VCFVREIVEYKILSVYFTLSSGSDHNLNRNLCLTFPETVQKYEMNSTEDNNIFWVEKSRRGDDDFRRKYVVDTVMGK
jgi:hypothetical protein